MPLALSPPEVQRLAGSGASLLDVRSSVAFGTGHVAGSINVGLSGQFASWAGSLIPSGLPIVLVADDVDQVREAATRPARVGLENVAGYLDGGVAAWDRAGLPLLQVPQVGVDALD